MPWRRFHATLLSLAVILAFSIILYCQHICIVFATIPNTVPVATRWSVQAEGVVCLLSQAKECARDLTGRRNTEILRQVNCSHADSHDPL